MTPDRAPGGARIPGARIGFDALGGGLAVAAGLVVLARWVPLAFEARPNLQGIASATARSGYPSHQEPILYVAFGALGVLLLWPVAAALGRRALTLPWIAGLEALAGAALAGALMLPRGAATIAVGAALAGFGVAAWRWGEATREEPPASPAPLARIGVGLLAGLVTLAALRVARVFQAAWLLALGTPDERLTRADWVFQAEDGQHVAWADALANGLLHGRDFFSLYGPLYDWSIVGLWQWTGRSLAGWHLHVGLTEMLGWLAFLLLAATLLRTRWLLLPLAVVTPFLTLRLGLALAALLFLVRYVHASRTRDAAWAGVFTGLGLLYSQEYGLAVLIAAAPAFAATRAPRAVGAWAGAWIAVVVPLLAYYAAAGALGPMLADLAGYPAAVAAGYGNLPFPSLRASVPWPFALDPVETRVLRQNYALGAISAVALAWSLPRVPLDLGRPLAWIGALLDAWRARPERLAIAMVALFGCIAFRTALGRSDTLHLWQCTPTAILLGFVAIDRALSRWREARPAAGVQLGFAAVLALWSGIATGAGAAGVYHLSASLDTLDHIVRGEGRPEGNGAVNRLVAWLERNAEPEDRFYFLPNDAALYYLTDRRPTTRWVVSHQMVTDAHRSEALADLQADPPRYVVWNDGTLRLDDVPDAVVLGPETWRWLHANYGLVERVGGARIWEYGAGPTELPPEP